MPGFHVDEPGPNQIQVYTPIMRNIQPGQDVTFCTYLDGKTSKMFDVTGYRGYQSFGGHHVILYTANHTQPVGTHECTEDDMTNVRYIAGGGTDAALPAQYLPEGIVFRVAADKQMMIVNHWINSSDSVIDGQSAFNITIQDPKPESSPADLLTVVNTMMEVPPGTSVTHSECTLKQDMKMFLMGAHAHEHGTRTVLKKTPVSGEATTIQDIPWSKEMIFNTPLVNFTKDAPFTFAAGDKYSIDCSYNNAEASAIPFPAEMCIAYGYYYPATAEIDCIDGNWPI